ncbi:MAG: metallophosphoesterase, partial [Chitinophagaceae bacterium]
YPETIEFMCEEMKVVITHIGGYPPKYNPAVLQMLKLKKPGLFICGHSHLLKVMYDQQLGILHMNPGAAGKQGWHKIRTVIRFEIVGAAAKNCEVIELGTRG